MSIERWLYRFQAADEVWCYVSDNGPAAELAEESYAPVTIRHSEVQQSARAGSPLTVWVARDNALGRLLLRGGVESVAEFTLFRLPPTGPAEQWWYGRALGARGVGPEVEIACAPFASSQARQGATRRFSTQCQHCVYDEGCGLDADEWAVPAIATAVEGAVLTVPDAALQDDGWYFGGHVRVGAIERLIVGHVGAEIRLLRAVPGLEADDEVLLHPGCDGSIERCDGVFENVENCFSFPGLPDRDPFDQSIV